MNRTNRETDSLVLEVDRKTPFDGFQTVSETLSRPRSGGVLLAVERFSLATNNLGYVLLDDVLHTLDAFPASMQNRARTPVWGIAEVIAADPSVATVGARVACFLPMATHAAVRVAPTDTGLLSIDEKRLGMLPIYRRLTLVTTEPGSEDADVETVLLPVSPFAALLAGDITALGARTVVVSSASSRSAAALGRLLAREGIGVIGLTSAEHRSAAESFAVYDRILSYDEIDALDPSDGTAYVDVAGSIDVTSAVHHRLGHHLSASIGVGGTHARSLPSVPGPPLSMFNTGDREADLTRERGWPAVASLYQDARTELISWATRWLRVETVRGLAATESVWRDIVCGHSNPLSAVVIRPE